MKKAIVPFGILLIAIIGIFLYINRFIIFGRIEINGYALNSDTIVNNLSNGITSKSKKITYESVNVNDTIYISGKKYYVGNKQKKNISSNYPIISSDASTLLILNNVGNYIDDSFIKTSSFANTMITDSHLYSSINNEQIDESYYYFIELNNGLYNNTQELTVTRHNNEIIIPTNSFIMFQKDYLRYYYLKEDSFIYKDIPVIDYHDNIKIGKFEDNYLQLLINLGIINIDKEENENIDLEEKEKEKESEEKKSEEESGTEQVDIYHGNEEYETKKEYIEPKITLNNPSVNIYSFRGYLTIEDPMGYIVKKPTFDIQINGVTYTRKEIINNGSFVIGGLLPNTTYDIIGNYVYENEYGKKVNRQFYKETLTTKDIIGLETINIEKKSITANIFSIAIEGLHFNNKENEEALLGISEVILKIGNQSFKLPARDLGKLSRLEEVNFQTPQVLNSNTLYDGEIQLYDVSKNLMKTLGGSFSIKTKKSPPKGKITVSTDKNFQNATLNISINNDDNLIVNNYRYIVFLDTNEEIARKNISQNTKTSVIENLDTGKKYIVKLLCDYYNDEGKLIENYEITTTEFITYNIEKQESIPFTIQEKLPVGSATSITSSGAIFNIVYTNYNSTDLIYNLLDKDVKIEIINDTTNEVVQRFSANKNDFIGLGFDINIRDLVSNTKYRIEVKPVITTGNRVINIKTTYNKNSFITHKVDPSFDVLNLFIASGYIDFDAVIYDKDSSIAEDKVTLNVYDEKQNKVYTNELDVTKGVTNENNEILMNRVTLKGLSEPNTPSGGTYTFKVIAENYDNNYIKQSNREIENERKYTLSGTYGNIKIKELVETSYYYAEVGSSDGKNLFNIKNYNRWKSSGANSNIDLMSIKRDTNSVILSAKNAYRVYSYYIPELIGKPVTISFKIRKTEGDQNNICLINGIKTSCDNKSYKMQTLTDEYSEHSVTFSSLDTSGYISFYIYEVNNNNNTTSIELLDLQIEEGSEASSSYQEFEDADGYVGKLNVNINDALSPDGTTQLTLYDNRDVSDNINSGNYEYYIRFVCSEGNCKEDLEELQKIEEEELPITQSKEIFNITKDAKYTGLLSIYNPELDRFYDISETFFVSDNEARTISSPQEFYNMHATGYYIVTEDLDLRKNTQKYTAPFQGNIDFQGHKLYLGSSNSALFSTISGGAVIKNVDIHYDLATANNNAISFSGLYSTNYGTISNVKITLETINDAPNTEIYLLGYWNYGVIENFVLYGKTSLIGSYGLSYGVGTNYGTIKNGYAYGEPIIAKYTNNNSNTSKRVGVFANNSPSGSEIKNIYSLMEIQIGQNPIAEDYSVGNIASSIATTKVSNAIIISPEGTTNRNKTLDINFGNSNTSLNYNNLYYISNISYADKYTSKISDKSLNNPKFLSNLLNDEDMFLTDIAWKNKTMPQLNWPSYMPQQDYIDLVDLASIQNVKFISVDSIKYLNPNDNEGYIAEIEMSLFNKNNARIDKMVIEGFDDDDIYIVNPTTRVNNDKIQILIVRLKAPKKYVSNYKLKQINIPSGQIAFDDDLGIDLYRDVTSIKEINSGISNGDTNFRLINDIDCTKDKCTDTKIATVKGKINGDGHTIYGLTSKGCFINQLDGILTNIVFDHFTVNPSGRNSGLICRIVNTGIADKITVKSELIHADNSNDSNNNAFIGGIAAELSNGTIQNSSVNIIEIDDSRLENKAVRVGGLAGTLSNSTITNSFARNISYYLNSVNSEGIGGIAGRVDSGNINNVYSTGVISTNGSYVGGIAGYCNGRINSAIGNVEVISQQDFVGQIAGSSTTNSLKKTIAIGNITSLKDNPTNLDRTSGVRIEINGNYVWDKQKVNSKISLNSSGETFLTDEDLKNSVIYSSKVGFGNDFELGKNFRSGYIPAIKSIDGEILPNQGYENHENLEDLEIRFKEYFKHIDSSFVIHYESGHQNDEYYADYANATIYLNNPEKFLVNSIEIDGIEIQNFDVNSNDNITVLTFIMKPTKYFDNYTISKINYYDPEHGDNRSIDASIKLNTTFYKKLSSVNDWQNIKKGYAENYIVLNDINFKDVSNLQKGVTFNSLIGMNKDNNIKIGNMNVNNPLVLNAGEALIDNIGGRVENIDFENISLKSTKSGNYIGVIKYLNGVMKNVNFNSVTVDAEKINYSSIISYNKAQDIRNITINNVNIKGKSYVGGFIARSEAYDVTNVNLKNVNVTANGNYAGGLIGHETWDVKTVHTYNIIAEDITVKNSTTANSYTGGIFGYGSGNVISLKNSTVTGFNRVGGISGESGNRNTYYNYVNNSTINGYGTYVGGIVGVNQNINYSYVTSSTISGNNKANAVGGIAGHGGWTVAYSGINDSKVVGGKNYVGAVKGTCSWCTIRSSYAKDIDVKGESYVGGIVGNTISKNNNIYLNMTNAFVVATNSKAGGIVGYIPNLNTTTADNITRIYRNIVAGAAVVAPTNVGGLIGDMQNELFVTGTTYHFYQNYISADVLSTSASGIGGYVLGWSKGDISTSKMNTWGIYGNSTYNGVTVNDSPSKTNLTAKGTIITDVNNLKKLSTYNGFSKNDFEEVANKFPRIKTSENSERGNYKVEFDLPPSTRKGTNYTVQSFQSTGSSPLPTVSGYAVDVDKINITFSSTDYDNVKFIINENEYELKEKTYTFYYDFKEDVVIKITDGRIENTTVLLKDDLKNTVSIVDGNYYSIEDNIIISNDNIKMEGMNYKNSKTEITKNDYLIANNKEIIASRLNNDERKAVNIYDNKILLDNKNIYDVENKTIIENDFDNLTLISTKPLYTYNYENQIIKTYNNYSTIDGEKVDKMIIIVNDQIEFIAPSMQLQSKELLIDNYNGKNYFVYLNSNGKLVSLKDSINYPKDFKNNNIEFISTGSNQNDKILFVKYKNGNYIVFNYLTGNIIGKNKNNNTSLIDFMKDYISNSLNNQKKDTVNKNYLESKKLVEKLKTNPIEKVLDNHTNNTPYISKSNYSITYNPTNKEYEIYEIPSTTKANNTSLKKIMEQKTINELINSNEKLINYYKLADSKKIHNISSILIVTIIISTIGISVLILKKYFKKNKNKQ